MVTAKLIFVFKTVNDKTSQPLCYVTFMTMCELHVTVILNNCVFVRYKILKIIVLDVIECSLADRYQRFGGTCYLHFQGKYNLYPEDRGIRMLRNTVTHLLNYVSSHLRTHQSLILSV
jgi:hypothetical protein